MRQFFICCLSFLLIDLFQPVKADPIRPRDEKIPGRWQKGLTFVAGSLSCQSQGQLAAGTATSVAYAGKDGSRLLVGFNDNRLRSFDPKTGEQLWLSRPLTNDVADTSGCDQPAWAVARINNGDVYLFYSEDEKEFIRFTPGLHRLTALTPDCKYVVMGTLNGIQVYDSRSVVKLATIPQSDRYDHDGVRLFGNDMIIDGEKGFELWRINKPSGPVPLAQFKYNLDYKLGDEDLHLTQVYKQDDLHFLIEYCGPKHCHVEVQNHRNHIWSTFDFATEGSTEAPNRPSTLELSPTFDYLFFTRLGLPSSVVHLKSQTVQELAMIPPNISGGPSAAFSPKGDQIALSMYPKSYEVTLFDLIYPEDTEKK